MATVRPYIIVEANIPFIKGLLEPYARVAYLKPEEFTSESIAEADALLIRTRTVCNESLLSGSKVSFIGTATIGTDHIDLPWCESQGITVANAPGCNAPAVAQYVLSSIIRLADRPLDQYTIGIIGVGHVGSIVESWVPQLGMRVLLNDPPRQEAEGGSKWVSLERVSEEADIITVHTPLDSTTRHLLSRGFIAQMKRKPIVVNAARGAIVDTGAIIDGLKTGAISHAVIDCWEHEPDISTDLLSRCAVATPHIAGYSHEGKVRATRMVLDAVCTHFSLPHITMDEVVPPGACRSVSAKAITDSYNPFIDTDTLKSAPDAFESLRNHYALRHEVQ